MVTKTHLSHEDIKSFLTHTDAFMRRAAAEYLERCPLDQGVADLVMESLRTFGPDQNQWVLAALAHTPFRDDQYSELLELCRGKDDVTSASLHNVLCFAPVSFLKANLDTISSLPFMEQAVVDQIKHKISLVGQTPQQIWADLKQLSEESSEDFEAAFDYDIVSDKNRVLAAAAYPSNEMLMDLLLEPEVEGEWLEIFIIELLGMRRCVEAVPTLVSFLEDSDAELLVTHSTDALARINAPEALELLQERYMECDDDPIERLMIIDAALQLRLPELKALLKFFLNKETDPACRTLLFMGLCQRFDAEGVKAAIRAARSGDFEPEFTDLRADVIAYADMLGLTLEERSTWLKVRTKHEAALEEKFRELIHDQDDPETEKGGKVVTGTFVRDNAKVGRNDLCPCGSGKKYKSCCITILQ